MSGHSKWSTIKRKKAAEDAKRGKVFTRVAREIVIAARVGGSDPDTNFRLRLAMDRAKAANMPKGNIERAIARATGEGDGAQAIEEILYEGYAPHGVALLVSVLTDNRNRSLSDIKRVFTRAGGSLAEPNAVAWQFEQKGYITLPSQGCDYEDVFLMAAEAGAEEVIQGEEFIEIYTPRGELAAVQKALVDAGIPVEEGRLDWIPKMEMELALEKALKVMGVIEQLEELDDVEQVYSNLNITDELMASYASAA
jgi:YebC/PmpR family DNA-binding regulatory protein